MIILPGPASKDLANSLATELKARLVPVFFKKFPDGESYIRIDGDVQEEDVVIVQTTSPPQDARMMQLFLLASAAKNQDAKRIRAVVPYFAYSRQDKVFLPGEAFSAKTVVGVLKTCGVTQIITVNAHNSAALEGFTVPVKDLSAIPLLAEYFRDQGFKGAVSLSMGKKGLATAKEAADVLKGGYDYVLTRRDRHTGKVSIEEKPLEVKGKVAIFFDDIISSGGTMMKAVAHAKNQGATKVYAACVHPILIANAKEKIIQSGADEVVGTDSVPSPVSGVSVAPIIAEALI
ncbi:MAG: ribose-phosphate diphosphokinase [Candidatus Bathyarchaeota archaeon]|nr:ribose-phosphate diphosphokinase [Candidatus Bathyarchaeota archaeon]MDH5494141.1 ribose-phosphate diphosphokinase [Candidatus Bathyarchaeota archaeon]